MDFQGVSVDFKGFGGVSGEFHESVRENYGYLRGLSDGFQGISGHFSGFSEIISRGFKGTFGSFRGPY